MDSNTVYQHGNLALLVPGLFDGTITIDELLQHGDSGIGTLTKLYGEVIILNGIVYQATDEGKIHKVSKDQTMPFSTVHFNSDDKQQKEILQNTDMKNLEENFERDYQLKNVFAAIKIEGIFKDVHVRVVSEQEKPYPTLTEATAKQAEFKRKDVKGTVIGYYSPELYSGTTVAGFHLHFISEDETFGGHLLDFKVQEGESAVQIFKNFNLHLPIENKDFRNTDFNLTILDDEIDKAEK